MKFWEGNLWVILRKELYTVLGPYREQIVIFRKIISVPIGNKPKIWVTQKKIIFATHKSRNLDLNLSPITRILLFYEYQDLLNIIKIRSCLNLSYSNRFYVTPVLGNYSSNTEIRGQVKSPNSKSREQREIWRVHF